MRFVLSASFGLLLIANVSLAEPIYLMGDITQANSINRNGLVVGHCLTGVDFIPCYWDLNEAPHQFTDPFTMVTEDVLDSHLVSPIFCAIASSEILDVTDAGEVLGWAVSREVGCTTNYYTGQIPNFTGWTPLPLLSMWTHEPTLENSQWIMTNGSTPFEPGVALARVDAVPEPSSFSLVGLSLCILLVYAFEGRSRLPDR